MVNDSFIPSFNSRFEVAISENKEIGEMEFIGERNGNITIMNITGFFVWLEIYLVGIK